MAILQFTGDYRFLSNFWFVNIISEHTGLMYPTVEHYFQAHKCEFPEQHQVIRTTPKPQEAKALGKIVELRPDWEEIKLNVMLEGLRLKFSKPEMAQKLLATGNQVLVEGNWWCDQEWGNCHCGKHAEIPGKNMLGTSLMLIRDKLQQK